MRRSFTSRITLLAFTQRYYKTWANARRLLLGFRRVPWPCSCGDEMCDGWQMINVREKYIGYPWFCLKRKLADLFRGNDPAKPNKSE